MKEKIKKSLPNLVTLGTSVAIMLLMFFSGIGFYISSDNGLSYRLFSVLSIWDCAINSLGNSLGNAFARLLIISIFLLLLIFILSLILLLKDLNVIKKDFGEVNYPRILRILVIAFTCITFLNMFILIGACRDFSGIVNVAKIRFMPIFLWIVGLALVVFLYLDKIIFLFNKIKNKTIKINAQTQEETPEQVEVEPEEVKEEPISEHAEPQVMPKGPKIAPPINRNPNLNEGAPVIPHKKPNTEN